MVVRTYRQRLGLSQEELAWRAGMHRTYLADIERGGRNISLSNIVRLVNALGISLAKFFHTLEEYFQSPFETLPPSGGAVALSPIKSSLRKKRPTASRTSGRRAPTVRKNPTGKT
jgi:transcriptional regulator with XRE-family HTH domain